MYGTYRTLLALMVVGLHIGGIPSVGTYAVFGFYTLSGYLMTFIMQNNYGYSSQGVAKYAINRFLRIYPIYWVSIGLSAVLVLVVGEGVSSGYQQDIYLPKDPVSLARNLALFFPFMESPRLTPPAWALTVELCFYILIGLGISRTRRAVWYWFLLSAAYHALALYFGRDTYFTVFAASLPFSTGALIFHYRSNINSFLSGGGGGRHGFPLAARSGFHADPGQLGCGLLAACSGKGVLLRELPDLLFDGRNSVRAKILANCLPRGGQMAR